MELSPEDHGRIALERAIRLKVRKRSETKRAIFGTLLVLIICWLIWVLMNAKR